MTKGKVYLIQVQRNRLCYTILASFSKMSENKETQNQNSKISEFLGQKLGLGPLTF